MKPIGIRLAVISLALLSVCGTGRAELKILWQRQFGLSEQGCSPGVAAFDKTNNRLVVMGTSYKSLDYTQPKLWLWGIDRDGNRVIDAVVRDVPVGHDVMLGPRIVKDMALSGAGDIFVAGQFNDAGQSIMRITAQGRPMWSRPIVEDPCDVDLLIHAMIPLEDNAFILAGRDDSYNGLLIKVDSSGSRIWKRVHDLRAGKDDFFTDGVAADSRGEFIAVGCSTDTQKTWPRIEQKIYIVRFNAAGDIILSQSFPGSDALMDYPSITKLRSGSLVVIYNKVVDYNGCSFQAKAFTPSLSPMWEKMVFSSDQTGDGPFAIESISVAQGGFVAAGYVNYGDLRVLKYDQNGNLTDTLSIDKAVDAPAVKLACTSDEAFVVLEKRSTDDSAKSEVKVIAIGL